MDEKFKADPHNVREMKIPEDLDQVMKLWLNEVKDAHKEFIPTGFWDTKEVLDNFKAEISNKEIKSYVYEEDGIVKGFITAWSLNNSPQTAYLAELYVDFDFQRQKIGTILFETLKGENSKFPQLKGKYTQFTSDFYAHNFKSYRWHLKSGFEISGIKFCSHTWLPKFKTKWEKTK